jgi:hypothetical protein
MKAPPHPNLDRPTLYRRLARAVILASLLLALVQDEEAQLARRETSKGPRALALLEIAPNGKAHLVPITLMYDGKFYDAGAYKGSPVPMALESDTIYEGLKTGTPQGLFTVQGARRVPAGWIGEGNWEPAGSAPPAKKPTAPVKSSEENRERPPVLRHAGPGNPKPAEPSSAPKEPAPSPPPASPQKPTPPPQPEADKDRPVLRRGKPGPVTKEPTPSKAETPTPDTKANSGKVQVMLAISDSDGPEPRPYTFQMKPEEEQTFRNKMVALAINEVRVHDRELAEKGSGSSPPGSDSSHAPKTAKISALTLDDVQLKAFDLTNANEPVLVLTAKAHMPSRDLQYYVTVVGHEDVYGEVHKAFANISDLSHLDVIPRLDLVDAVDADGDGRGELLFRRVSDTGSAYDLYRVIGDKLYALYQGTPQ